jgi:CO dehydrogenase maturation factor
MHVAVLGKGGSGKSVIAGTLARMLARRGRQVLTLDSDMMPGLTLSLGLGLDSSAMLTDAVEKNEQGRWRLRKGISNHGLVRAVQRYAVTAPDGVRHLQCGKLDEAGQPAIMPSINGYYQLIHRLSRSEAFKGWTIIGDLPAGPRQVAYRWAPYADTFVLMVEPSWKSALTARRIATILRSTPGTAVMPVASKVTGAADRRAVERMLGEPVVVAIPADRAVGIAERAGVAPIDHAPESPAMQAIETLATTLEAQSDPQHRQAA